MPPKQVFTMGIKAAKVLAPEVGRDPVPDLTGGFTKARSTMMYCANAEVQLMPPYIVFPKKKPTGYDELWDPPKDCRIH